MCTTRFTLPNLEAKKEILSMCAQLPRLNDKCVVRVQDFIMREKLIIAHWWEECTPVDCSSVQYCALCSAVHCNTVSCEAE